MNKSKKEKVKIMMLTIAAMVLLAGCQVANPNQKDELAYRKAGIQFLNKRDYESAINAFQKALDNSNGRISEVELDICYYKAYALIQDGQDKEAIKIYDAIIDYDKEAVKAYLQRGNIYAAKGKLKQACEDYEKAISLDKNDFELYIAAYENLNAVEEGREQAKKYLKQALSILPSSGEACRNKGRIYLLLEDYDNAKQMLSQAENEGDEEAKLYMAQALLQTGDTDGAYAIYKHYAQIHKEDVESQCKLVELLMAEGDYENALTYVASAKKIADDEHRQDILRWEIISQENLGNFSEAKELLSAYLEEYPKDEEAQRELLFLKTRLKDKTTP